MFYLYKTFSWPSRNIEYKLVAFHESYNLNIFPNINCNICKKWHTFSWQLILNVQLQIEVESQTYGDLVQGGFMDSYHNLSYKNLFGKMWVSEFCEQAEFVVKTDDDMYVDLYAVYKITRPYLTHQVTSE